MKINTKQLKERVSTLEVLNSYDHRLKIGKEKAHGHCPFPGHNDTQPSFVIFLNSGYYKCSCGDGDVVDFVKNMEGCRFATAVQILRRFALTGSKSIIAKTGVLKSRLRKAVYEEPDDTSEPPKLPSGKHDWDAIVDYLGWRRGYTKEQAERLINNFPMYASADERYNNSIIFPIYNVRGVYRNYQTQMMVKPPPPRNKLFGPGSGLLRDCLYGWPQTLMMATDWCVVVEGIADVFKLWTYRIPAIGTLTASVTDEQASAIIKRFEKIYIGYDRDSTNDETGAGGIAAKKLKAKVVPYVDCYRLAMLPGKDPDLMSPKEITYSINNAYRM